MQEEFGVYNLFLNCLFWLKVNPLKINLLKVLTLTPMQAKSIDFFLFMWKITVNGLTRLLHDCYVSVFHPRFVI